MEPRAQAVAVAAPLVSFCFFWLWWVQRRTEDASLVDVAWAAALGALAVFYAAFSGTVDVPAARRLALALVVGTWSARLAWHIYARHRGGPEDERYRDIREARGGSAQTFFFVFFQAQGLLALVLSLPFLLVAFHPAPRLTGLEVVGFALAVTGVVGESIADRQLSRHRSDPANRGKTCRSGLWRYSRHPNYFFEWVVWCGFAVVALSAPWGALGLLSPVVMLVLILFVTGIPPTEARAVKSRGDDYRAYQASTSAFFPWFPAEENDA